jgi:hypothetical protein
MGLCLQESIYMYIKGGGVALINNNNKKHNTSLLPLLSKILNNTMPNSRTLRSSKHVVSTPRNRQKQRNHVAERPATPHNSHHNNTLLKDITPISDTSFKETPSSFFRSPIQSPLRHDSLECSQFTRSTSPKEHFEPEEMNDGI